MHKDMLGYIQKCLVEMIPTFLLYMTINIIMMYDMCRKELDLLRKTVANDEQ